MSTSRSIWHSSVLVLALAGCSESHDPSRGDGGAPVRDAAPIVVDSGVPDPIVEELDTCEEALRHLRAGGREGVPCNLPPIACMAAISECCTVHVTCEGTLERATLRRQVSCNDSCAQGCDVLDASGCNLDPTCEWLDDGACGPAPDGLITGPACIDRRGAECEDDDDCEAGVCNGYWVNPCAGEGCAACGAEEHRCAAR